MSIPRGHHGELRLPHQLERGGVYGLSGSRVVMETVSQSRSDSPAAVKVFQDPNQTASESSLTAETGDKTGF